MVPEINLLPKLEGKKSNPLFLLVISAAIILCMIVYFAIQFISLKSDIVSLTTQETQLVADKASLEEELLQASTQNKGNLSTSVAFVEGVSYIVTPLTDEIHRLLLPNTYLKSYEFSEYEIKLAADFETMTDVAVVVERLAKSDYFSDVKIDTVKNFELDPTASEGSTDFSIIPRYSVDLVLPIDPSYVSVGGARP